MSDKPIPAAVIYAAKSTEDRHDSIPDQLRDCRKMAADEGWEVVGEDQDEKFSAYTGNRGPGLENVTSLAAEVAAERGAIVMLVAQAHDRFARGAGDQPGAPQSLGELWHWARRRNVWLRTFEDDEELRDEASVAAIGRRAHIDSKRKSKSVKKGMRRRAARGQTIGGPRPFGYRHRDALPDGRPTGPLVICESEAAVIRRVFAEYVAGRSQRRIVRDLNRDGLRTQRGSEWVQGTVAKLLASPLYVGKVRMNGKVYAGNHEPIIDTETWQKAEQLRKASARTGLGRRPLANHLLAGGLLRCGCGSAMGATTKPTRTPGVNYEVYACSGRAKHGLDYCPQRPIKRALIDGAVWDFFEKVALDVDATKAAITEQHDAKLAEIAALRNQADRDVIRASDRLTRVRRDYQDGKLDADDWSDQRTELTAELEAGQAQVTRLDGQRTSVTTEMDEIDVEATVLEELTALRAMVTGEARAGSRAGADSFRAALRRLFDRFELLGGARPFGSDVDNDDRSSVGWPHDDLTVALDDATLVLYPHVRAEAVVDWWDDSTQFPALKRAALALSGNDANTFVTKSSAPFSKPRTREISSARPVRITSGTEGSSRDPTPSASRTRRTRSSPDPSGSPRSISASSGRLYSSNLTASRIVSASRTSYPSAVRLSARNVRSGASSSTSSRVVASSSSVMPT